MLFNCTVSRGWLAHCNVGCRLRQKTQKKQTEDTANFYGKRRRWSKRNGCWSLQNCGCCVVDCWILNDCCKMLGLLMGSNGRLAINKQQNKNNRHTNTKTIHFTQMHGYDGEWKPSLAVFCFFVFCFLRMEYSYCILILMHISL